MAIKRKGLWAGFAGAVVAGALLLAGCGSQGTSGALNFGAINFNQVGLALHTAVATINPGSQSLTGVPTNPFTNSQNVNLLGQPNNIPTFNNNGTTLVSNQGNTVISGAREWP